MRKKKVIPVADRIAIYETARAKVQRMRGRNAFRIALCTRLGDDAEQRGYRGVDYTGVSKMLPEFYLMRPRNAPLYDYWWTDPVLYRWTRGSAEGVNPLARLERLVALDFMLLMAKEQA